MHFINIDKLFADQGHSVRGLLIEMSMERESTVKLILSIIIGTCSET